MSPPPPANAPPPPLGSSAPLPEGWAEAFTEDGGRYYWNASTGATSWEMPTSTGVVTKPAAFPQQRGLDNIGSPIAAVKAMNASSSKKAEGLAPRLTSLQAANGDLAEARATAQQKVEELKAAADQASTAAMGAVQVAAALASQAHGSAAGAKQCHEAEEAAKKDLEVDEKFLRELNEAREKVGKETETAYQTKAVCDAEVGAAEAGAVAAQQAYAAALDKANEASRKGEDARALVISTEARAAAAEQEAKVRKDESLQWDEQVTQ